ncbi:MAG TPA: secondary thiamine-phosphate synthase enzyme YjbQ [Vicinamibacteria bacterium]|nr:secondary thiamine-phosphate synthase enzyme YjbQ [Vicinamibacteria bacterium]
MKAARKAGGSETVRVITETIRLATDKRLELYNLTERVADVLRRHDIKEGMVLLSSLHTTMALFVNEWQAALLHDVKSMLEKVVSPCDSWQHNDPALSDCDRHNAHSHLQASLLGHALSFSVSKGRLVLGQFQAIIAAELDGPRDRDLAVQIIGR